MVSFDLSNNPLLKTLDCSKNQLTLLQLEGNPNVEDINCNENQLSSLTIKDYTSLTRVSCEKNKISSLDISNNNALLELKIGDNPIVRKFASEFGDCKEAYYIAIIPEQKETFDKPDSSYDGFDIYYVSWKELYDSFNNYGFLDKVILYNQINEVDAPKAKSQILNNI